MGVRPNSSPHRTSVLSSMSVCFRYFSSFVFTSRRRHTRLVSDWSSDVCSSDLGFARDALREPASRFLVHQTVPVPAGLHVIRKNLTLVKSALGISVPDNPADFDFPIGVSSEHELEAEAAAAGTEGRYAILNPGGGWPTKLWSADKFGALAEQLLNRFRLHSLVTYGPGEAGVAEQALAASHSGKARGVCLSLKGFVALARDAQVYVGGDTGPTHLAVAARTPVVGLFGPTEWWRNGSPNPDDVCVERTDIDCRVDCHRRACSKWICMDIDVERVMHAVTDRLSRAGRIAPLELISIG